MRTKLHSFALSAALFCAMQVSASESEIAPAQYDAALAKKLGADERGMRKYVLVILKTGPHRVPDGAEREDMFKGHFANIERLANAGLLVMAGPLDGVDGWRGLFMFAVNSIDEASKLVATDPVIVKGEMVAEYHEHYGSAALMLVNDWHKKLSRPQQ
ncbi:MAG: YciI family protein [Povalibacter sp.]